MIEQNDQQRFYKEFLIGHLQKKDVEVRFPDLPMHIEMLAAMESCRALKRIRDILNDHTMDDPECFDAIERIIKEFEDMCFSLDRHDFG